jgi:hypothetical protein
MKANNLSNFYECYGFLPNLTQSYKANGIHDKCKANLKDYLSGKCFLKYSTPAIWKKPSSDHQNCLICKSDYYFKNARYVKTVKYIKNSNMVPPVLNDGFNSICAYDLDAEYFSEDSIDKFSELDSSEDEKNDPSFEMSSDQINEQEKFSQQTITTLINLLGISPSEGGRILASFFKKNNLVEKDFRIGEYENYLRGFERIFSNEDDGKTAFMTNIEGN